MKELIKLVLVGLLITSCNNTCDLIDRNYLGTDCDFYGNCFDVYEDIYECETVTRYEAVVNE